MLLIKGKKPGSKFNPGLALIGLRTTGSRIQDCPGFPYTWAIHVHLAFPADPP